MESICATLISFRCLKVVLTSSTSAVVIVKELASSSASNSGNSTKSFIQFSEINTRVPLLVR